MGQSLGALLLASSLLVAGMASAATSYVVDRVSITGSKTIPPEKLYAAIQVHKGSVATQDDIVADQGTITKMLGAANVVGGIKTSMKTKSNKHIEVIFAIDDQGVQAPVVTTIASKLHKEIFDGNKSIPSDKLAAASGLAPGDTLTNEKIVAAEKAIAAAYTAAKLPVNVALNGETKTLSPGQVDVTWHIVETKLKAKKDSNEGQREDPQP